MPQKKMQSGNSSEGLQWQTWQVWAVLWWSRPAGLQIKRLQRLLGGCEPWARLRLQLVKLACSFTVNTPWFLILDADTFFLSPMEALDLMQQKACTNESVVCDLKRQAPSPHQPPLFCLGLPSTSSSSPELQVGLSGTVHIVLLMGWGLVFWQRQHPGRS